MLPNNTKIKILKWHVVFSLQVFLTLEPRIFKFHDESIFRNHNGKKFSKYNREFDVFKDRLFEFDISFIPRYKIVCRFLINFVVLVSLVIL